MGEDERILIRNFLHSARLPGEGCPDFVIAYPKILRQRV